MFLSINRITCLLLSASFIVLFFSCSEKAKTSGIYNIDSLISAQVKVLASANATLHKSASLGSQTDESTYTPGDSAWNAELAIFRQLNLVNKPVNRSNYLVDDSLYDVSSNLTVKAISAIEDVPVRYVRIFYDNTPEKPRKIEAMYRDESILSETGRILTMEFQQVGDQNLLTGYSIHGGQKIIFGDTVEYKVEAKIVLN